MEVDKGFAYTFEIGYFKKKPIRSFYKTLNIVLKVLAIRKNTS